MTILKLFPGMALLTVLGPCQPSAVSPGRLPVKTFTGVNWQMQEIRFLQQNRLYSYKRDAADNSAGFDGDYVRFHPGGTGRYHQADGVEYEIKWRYAEGPAAGIVYTIENFREGQPLTVHWENIIGSRKTIRYTEYYTHADGTRSLGAGIRTRR